jgi:hypothetical protein
MHNAVKTYEWSAAPSFLAPALDGSGQSHAPTALFAEKEPTVPTAGWGPQQVCKVGCSLLPLPGIEAWPSGRLDVVVGKKEERRRKKKENSMVSVSNRTIPPSDHRLTAK